MTLLFSHRTSVRHPLALPATACFRRILIIGAEQRGEFAEAMRQMQQGHQVTVVNPIVTQAAQRYSALGGDFRPIPLEMLPSQYRYHLIWENYPYPLERTPQTLDFARQRFNRLKPGGRWVVITEHREFADTLKDIARTHGLAATLSRISLQQAPPAAPRYVHPQVKERYRLVVQSCTSSKF
jgi:hypothetical protein